MVENARSLIGYFFLGHVVVGQLYPLPLCMCLCVAAAIFVAVTPSASQL